MVDPVMSEINTPDLRPRSKFQQFIERHGIVWFIWSVLMIVSWRQKSEKMQLGELVGNDDFMRLTQIRDWLGGQSWYDLHQYRLNPADPLLSHWSRLPDILIGTPIKLLTPLFGSKMAETITITAYPSLLFLLLLFALVALTRTLSKTVSVPLAVAFMTPLSIPTFMQFQMGRIDHHGLQILMAAVCCLSIIKSAEKPKLAVVAGIICGLALYVGVESAPLVAAACISIVLIWVFDEPNSRNRMRHFGLSFAAVTTLCLLVSFPPSRWLVPSCDALSIVYTQLALLIGIVMWGLSAMSGTVQKPISRFGLAGILAIGSLVLIVLLYPNCLKGPYAEIDPRLAEVWLTNVAEAQTFKKFFAKDLISGMMGVTVPLFALIGFIVYHKQTGKGLSIAARSILIFMVVSFLAGLIQTRLMSFASTLAIPLGAYLLASSMDWVEKFKSMGVRLFLRISFIIIMAPVVLPLVVGSIFDKEAANKTAQMDVKDDEGTCYTQPILSKLNNLPNGLILSLVDLGAPILKYTKHSVTTAPYHRNTDGFMVAFDMFIENEAKAKAAAYRIEADYVIYCSRMNETNMLTRDFPEGMLTKLKTGYVPQWLEIIEIEDTEDLMVFRVIK